MLSVTEEGKTQSGLANLFSHRNFAIYASGNFPSQCGVWAQRLAIGWLTWELTESGFWLGLMGFADLIPVVLLSPFAGYLADRYDRVLLAKIIQFANIAVTGSLTVLAYVGFLNVHLLLLFAFLTGVDHAMFQPIRSSLASVLVSKKYLASAVAFNSFTWNSARLVGPALGAAILKFADANLVFLINTVLYVGFLVALCFLNLPPMPKRPPTKHGVLGEILDGYRYVIAHRIMGPLFLILFGASFLTRPLTELLPGFAAGIFKQGPAGLAILTAAMAVGAVLAGIWITHRGKLEGLAGVAAYAVLLGAIVLVVFTNTSTFEIAVICMVFFGIQYSLVGTCIQTIIQSVAEESMRGRVLSLYGLIWIGSAAMGALFMGALSEWFGLANPIMGGGFVCLGVWLFALRVRRPVEALIAKEQV